MAVAVKPNRETTTSSVLDRLPVGILMGVLYILGSIGIVFPLLDSIWWRWLGLDRTNLVAWSLLFVVGFLVALGLSVLGLRLMGPKPTPGLRAGITFALVWILIAVLLTAWLGMLIENAVLGGQWFGASSRAVGMGLTAGIGVILLILGFRFLFSAGNERRLVGLEEQGWFTTAPYKRNQGVRVRRGTILGILILSAFGLWSLHNTLSREGGDWNLAFPFTDRVQVELNTAGDNPELKDTLKQLQTKLDLDAAVESARRDVKLLQDALRDHPDASGRDKLTEELDQAGKDLPALKEDVAAKGESPDEAPRLQTRLDEINKRLADVRKALADQKIAVDPAPKVQPTLAVVPIDRFQLQDLNRGFANNYVKIKGTGQDPGLNDYKGANAKIALEHWDDKTGGVVFKPGEIVSKLEFDAVSEALREHRKQLEDKGDDATAKLIRLPTPEEAGGSAQVTPASGDLEYTQVTLLPNVKYTIPLLVGILALWMAWRLVNVPAFADFLIATEAEMNKVSWATRKQLAQDTVVVLVTVILMTIFLFFADVIWSTSLKMIGVLQSGQTAGQQAEKEVPW
jgi:preprotein translocase SecE subunit